MDIPDGYRINDLTLTMGGSSLKGELALTYAKRPKVTADLAADTLDLKDFGVTPGHGGSWQTMAVSFQRPAALRCAQCRSMRI